MATRLIVLAMAMVVAGNAPAAAPQRDLDESVRSVRSFNFRSLRQAVTDLSETFAKDYPRGEEFLKRLSELEAARAIVLKAWSRGGSDAASRLLQLAEALSSLREEALPRSSPKAGITRSPSSRPSAPAAS